MSDIAKVAVNGKELAIFTTTLAVVAQNGKELAHVYPNGYEPAKGGQDVAK
jgi:hypothetical protein